MPIFELDDGRPRLVQPMQPLAGSFAQEVTALVTHHLTAIAGEPLFVVRARGASDRADLPELLALDASGCPVVVDVAQVLDDDAILTALRHGGAAARMTTSDLARAYHADPTRFAVDYAAFRDQVPFGATAGRDRHGVRLLLLCSEVAAEAADTLGFLRGSDHRVDVLQVGVVRGDERRLLEVSPLALHEGVRRTVEPTALRLVRSSEAFATAMAYEPDRVPGPPPARSRSLPTGELRAVEPPPERVEPPAPTPIGRRGSVTEPTPLPFRTAGPTARPEPPADSPRPGAPGRPDITEWPRDTSVTPTAATLEGPSTLTPVAGLRAAVVDGPRPADVDAPTPPRGQPTADEPDTARRPVRPDWPFPELAMLAKRRRAVTTLVWARERRGQRFTAILRSDGMIELPDGTVVPDPDVAASEVSGVDGVDGWRAWRLGDGGPTLAEATGAL